MGVIRLGIVGCGWVTSTRHLPALARVPELDVVAVADVDPGALAHVADRFHVARRYERAEDLLADSAVEAVAVCVPASAHAAIALDALVAGKHVLVEKPLALSLADADRVVEAAAGTPLAAMVGFNYRWHRHVRRLRDAVRAGELGTLRAVRSSYTDDVRLRTDLAGWRSSGAEGGGTLLEKAIHHFDLWRYVLDDEVEELHAFAGAEAAEETAAVAARMRSGALASLVAVDTTSLSNELALYGTKVRAHLDLYRFDGLSFAGVDEAPGAARTRLGALAKTARSLPAGVRAARRGGEAMSTYEAQWRHFADAVRGRAKLEVALADGRAALAIALAARESATTGTAVSVASGHRSGFTLP